MEGRPPLKVEGFGLTAIPDHVAVAISMEAAQRAYQEACAKLQTGEVVRVWDQGRVLLLSSDPTETTDS
jgi:hypothetical protein